MPSSHSIFYILCLCYFSTVGTYLAIYYRGVKIYYLQSIPSVILFFLSVFSNYRYRKFNDESGIIKSGDLIKAYFFCIFVDYLLSDRRMEECIIRYFLSAIVYLILGFSYLERTERDPFLQNPSNSFFNLVIFCHFLTFWSIIIIVSRYQYSYMIFIILVHTIIMNLTLIFSVYKLLKQRNIEFSIYYAGLILMMTSDFIFFFNSYHNILFLDIIFLGLHWVGLWMFISGVIWGNHQIESIYTPLLPNNNYQCC